MMDKFIFYSTLKVSLCSEINSIWRTCFFWIRTRKHFWMETWRNSPPPTSSSVKFLTAVIAAPASALDLTGKQQLYFIFWLLWLKLLQMCQDVVQEFPRRKAADQQPGVTQCNQADCVHTWKPVSTYVMKEQSCFQSALFQNFNLHIVHCMVEEYILIWFLWMAPNWHHLSFNYTSSAFKSF